jgi:hypothetical protein
MKKLIPVYITLFFCMSCNITWCQTDSIEIKKNKIGIWYFGIGGGPLTHGGSFNLNFNIASSKYLGGSVNFRTGLMKSDNVPSDYYEDGLRVFAPKDYLNVLSFNFLMEFPTKSPYIRLGFETGPSWVSYKIAEFELNTNYSDPFWPLPQYKYYKSHVVKNTAGLYIAAKMDFPFIFFFGMDLSLYTVINNIQSVIGIDICCNLGKVGKEEY